MKLLPEIVGNGVISESWANSSHLWLFTFCRFKILDDEIGSDDLAAWACIRLDRLQTGCRLVHVFNALGNPSDGFLLVNIQKSLSV